MLHLPLASPSTDIRHSRAGQTAQSDAPAVSGQTLMKKAKVSKSAYSFASRDDDESKLDDDHYEFKLCPSLRRPGDRDDDQSGNGDDSSMSPALHALSATSAR